MFIYGIVTVLDSIGTTERYGTKQDVDITLTEEYLNKCEIQQLDDNRYDIKTDKICLDEWNDRQFVIHYDKGTVKPDTAIFTDDIFHFKNIPSKKKEDLIDNEDNSVVTCLSTKEISILNAYLNQKFNR